MKYPVTILSIVPTPKNYTQTTVAMDGLVLNLAVDDDVSSKGTNGKKGGRWTDRWVHL